MKRVYLTIAILCAVLTTFTACDNQDHVYEGPSYVLFADTLTVCPVAATGDLFAVDIASTRAYDYDRTFGVEVLQSASNAIEGYHYKIESYSVTIPSGSQTTAVHIRGIYDHIEETDSLGIKLRLVSLDDVEWDLYGIETKVRLQKVCPFVIENFTRYAVVESSFLTQFKPNAKKRLIFTERVAGKENTVLLREMFAKNYDVELTFDTAKWQTPTASLRSGSIIGGTDEFLGSTYVENVLRIENYLTVPSTFNACQNKVRLYSTVYVKDVGLLGNYETVVRWVSDEEAEDILKNGF